MQVSQPYSMDQLPSDRLAELIRKKLQILAQLRDVGQRQREMVELEDTTALLKLLAAKQHLITGLQAVEQQLKPFQEEDPESRKWRTTDDRAVCGEHAAQCRELLNEIVHLERRCEQRMMTRRNEVASQLKQVHAANEARDAYQVHQTDSGHFLPSRPVESRKPATSSSASIPTVGINLVSDC